MVGIDCRLTYSAGPDGPASPHGSDRPKVPCHRPRCSWCAEVVVLRDRYSTHSSSGGIQNPRFPGPLATSSVSTRPYTR